MPVYVDTPTHKPGRLRVSRMAADTLAELYLMVDTMGIRRRRISATQGIHIVELCKNERGAAIGYGAVEVPRLALTEVIRKLSTPHPEQTPLQRSA